MSKKWLNVYTVTRQFGGQEEGGWWYNDFYHIGGIQINNKKRLIKKHRKILEEKYRDLKWGNIYSMTSGEDMVIYKEGIFGEMAKIPRPHYE